MRGSKKIFFWGLVSGFVVGFFIQQAIAVDFPHPSEYIPTVEQIISSKNIFDDSRPFFETMGPQKILPKNMLEHLTYDENIMKERWENVVGFKAPEQVGKIAAEIKPGKYTYKEIHTLSGFKDLMIPELLKWIKPGGPPYSGNIPEFEVIPTKQYYYALPVAEMTNRYMGKSKQDEKGYLVADSWQGGIPFPRPEGKKKAQQIIINFQKRYISWGWNRYALLNGASFNKDLRKDNQFLMGEGDIRLAGRCFFQPYEWIDSRAKTNLEFYSRQIFYEMPRDIKGASGYAIGYVDEREVPAMFYVPSIRRIRRMTSSDQMDPLFGMDLAGDDSSGFDQILSPNNFPYEYRLIEEREYLVPALSTDGSEYISSDEGYAAKGLKFERRPLYKIEMTQLDPNYVYGKRIIYFDKETGWLHFTELYDQNGELYRTGLIMGSWFPKMGMISVHGGYWLFRDHIDTHSTIAQLFEYPAYYNREDFGVKQMMKAGK